MSARGQHRHNHHLECLLQRSIPSKSSLIYLLSSHRNGGVFRFNRDCGVSPRSGSLAVCDAPSDRCSCFPSAGIIGLDVALVLCKRGLGQYITIVAEHLPGDTSPSYTSPWYDALSLPNQHQSRLLTCPAPGPAVTSPAYRGATPTRCDGTSWATLTSPASPLTIPPSRLCRGPNP